MLSYIFLTLFYCSFFISQLKIISLYIASVRLLVDAEQQSEARGAFLVNRLLKLVGRDLADH